MIPLGSSSIGEVENRQFIAGPRRLRRCTHSAGQHGDPPVLRAFSAADQPGPGAGPRVVQSGDGVAEFALRAAAAGDGRRPLRRAVGGPSRGAALRRGGPVGAAERGAARVVSDTGAGDRAGVEQYHLCGGARCGRPGRRARSAQYGVRYNYCCGVVRDFCAGAAGSVADCARGLAGGVSGACGAGWVGGAIGLGVSVASAAERGQHRRRSARAVTRATGCSTRAFSYAVSTLRSSPPTCSLFSSMAGLRRWWGLRRSR